MFGFPAERGGMAAQERKEGVVGWLEGSLKCSF